MRIKYFTESAYLELFDGISDNISSYSLADNKWVKELFGDREYCKESRIESCLPSLDAADEEYSNVVIFYDVFKDKLSPKQASNPYLWAYLTHLEYWEYTNKRWAAEGMSVETVKQRFFVIQKMATE